MQSSEPALTVIQPKLLHKEYRRPIQEILQKPLKIKKHGRKARSVFRHGFDYLRQIVLNLTDKQAEFKSALRFLSCT